MKWSKSFIYYSSYLHIYNVEIFSTTISLRILTPKLRDTFHRCGTRLSEAFKTVYHSVYETSLEARQQIIDLKRWTVILGFKCRWNLTMTHYKDNSINDLTFLCGLYCFCLIFCYLAINSMRRSLFLSSSRLIIGKLGEITTKKP